MRRICLLLVSVLVAASAMASVHTVSRRTPVRHLSTRHHHRAHLRHLRYYGPPITPELRGSRDSLLRQNSEIDRVGLERIEDDDQLMELENSGALVPLVQSKSLLISPELHDSRRYCRPWTAQFASDIGREFYSTFHKPLEVTSAVRTMEQQKHLMRINGNAAPADGDIASSHLAGTTVDIGKRGLTRKEHKWVENYLARLKEQDVIEPEEERRQACFHVMVSNRYPMPADTTAKTAETAAAGNGTEP